MLVNSVQVVSELDHDFANYVSKITHLQVNLQVFCYLKLFLLVLADILYAENLASFIVRRSLMLFVIKVDFPVLSGSAVLVLDVEAIPSFQASNLLEFKRISSQVCLVSFNCL